ncbi:MAG: PQQ-binding-like beta-propeller repeat protein [Actinomycetota bacterium]|nr:PQQ-binding-like beta-propeller repeat protein [Actinomycetota bacterium]
MTRIRPLVCLLAVLAVGGCAVTSWSTYHLGNTRHGDNQTADLSSPRPAWTSPTLDGAVYGEPLVIGSQVVVTTENDSLYALDLADGHVLWGPTNVGTPVPQSSLQCGDIFPLGITSTPVVDQSTKTIYALAERTTGTANVVSHDLVAVDLTSGTVRWQHPMDPSAIAPLDRRDHQQRAALTLANGRVYVAFGGLAGDCGNYTGWVLSARADGSGTFPLETYKVPTGREGAIWGASGPAVDATGDIYVATGNGASTDPANYDHGNSIIKLSPSLVELDSFAPSTWAADSASDADLGSVGPTLLDNNLIFQAGKNGTAYLVDGNHLGGIGGQRYTAPLCRDFGGNAYRSPVVYVACTDGLRAVQINGPASSPTFTVLWHSTIASGSPVISGNIVWTPSSNFGGSVLYGLDLATGATVSTLNVGTMTHFTTPTVAGNRLLVAATDRIVAFQPHT